MTWANGAEEIQCLQDRGLRPREAGGDIDQLSRFAASVHRAPTSSRCAMLPTSDGGYASLPSNPRPVL